MEAHIEYTQHEHKVVGVYLVSRIDRLCLGFAQYRNLRGFWQAVPEDPCRREKDDALKNQRWVTHHDAVAGIVMSHFGATFYKSVQVVPAESDQVALEEASNG